jgi:hypothetical protein
MEALAPGSRAEDRPLPGRHRPLPADALELAIQRFPFDTILLAVNAADKHHFSFIDKLLPLAVGKRMGIIGMKVPGRGRLLSSWTPPPWNSSNVPGKARLSPPPRVRCACERP